MRRVLPLLVTAAITLAACSDDNNDSATELSLVEIESTEAPIDDVCATEAPASSDATATGVAVTGGTASASSAAGDTATGDTATDGSDGPASAVPGSTDIDDSNPDGSTADASTPQGSGSVGSDVEGSDTSESTESSEPVATSEPPDTGPYASAPEVEPVDSAPEELVRTVLEEGEGPEADVGDVVRVYYSGQLTSDGQVFDSNYGTDTPLEVVLAGEGEQPMVIEGWNEGLVGARAGDRIQLDIPSELAYGAEGNTSIPPDADLTFIVDVVDVISPELPEETPTELERTVIVEGPEDGAVAGDGTILYVDYLGVFSDSGAVFDSNFGPSGTPLKVELSPSPADGLPQGLHDGLHGARVGDRIQLDIPADLAYGEEGNGTIPPDSVLTYVVEVVDLIPMAYPEAEPDEVERTIIEEGEPDGTPAQFFDTVTFNMVIGVPEFAVAESTASSVPESSEAQSSEAQSSEPAGSGPTGDTAADDSTVPESGTPEGSGGPSGFVGPAAVTVPEGSDATTESTEPADSTAPPESSETSASTEPGESESESAPGSAIVNTYDAPPPDQTTGQQTPAQPVVAQLVRGGLGVPYPGLEDGLLGARPGDEFILTIPGDQGLGASGANLGIPEGATTVVYVEVLDVAAQPTIEVPEVAPTELDVTTLEEGTGVEAAEGDTVLVRYIAVVTDTNRRVDSNWEGAPEPLVLGDETYITGFEDGLIGAQAGEQLQIDIPADEAYGADSVPAASIPADTALSFLVDVVAVIPATSDADAPTDVELPLSSTPMTPTPATVDAATLESDPDATAPEALPEIVATDIVEGEGDPLTMGQTAIVNVYAVCASNGALLQNTWGDEVRQFITVSSSSIIDGFADGLSGGAELEGMRVGGLRTIQVPAALAYADRGSAELGIGPNRDIIFVVELYGFA